MISSSTCSEESVWVDEVSWQFLCLTDKYCRSLHVLVPCCIWVSFNCGAVLVELLWNDVAEPQRVVFIANSCSQPNLVGKTGADRNEDISIGVNMQLKSSLLHSMRFNSDIQAVHCHVLTETSLLIFFVRWLKVFQERVAWRPKPPS